MTLSPTMRRQAAKVAAATCLPVLATVYQVSAAEIARRGQRASTWAHWASVAAHTAWMPVLLLAEAGSFFLWMFVLGELPLSVAFPLTAMGLVFSLALSAIMLSEVVPPLAWIGTGAILGGAWLVVRSSQ